MGGRVADWIITWLTTRHTYTQQGNTYIQAQHTQTTYTQPVQTYRPTGRQAIRQAYRHTGIQGAMGTYIQDKWQQPIQTTQGQYWLPHRTHTQTTSTHTDRQAKRKIRQTSIHTYR